MTDYPFRLLCKRCNSYRFTTITQVLRPKMMVNLIRLQCSQCNVKVDVAEEVFDTEKKRP